MHVMNMKICKYEWTSVDPAFRLGNKVPPVGVPHHVTSPSTICIPLPKFWIFLFHWLTLLFSSPSFCPLFSLSVKWHLTVWIWCNCFLRLYSLGHVLLLLTMLSFAVYACVHVSTPQSGRSVCWISIWLTNSQCILRFIQLPDTLRLTTTIQI